VFLFCMWREPVVFHRAEPAHALFHNLSRSRDPDIGRVEQ